jgi:hypothetical protein
MQSVAVLIQTGAVQIIYAAVRLISNGMLKSVTNHCLIGNGL